LFKSYKKWKPQQAILWADVRRKTEKRKGQIQISKLFVEGEEKTPSDRALRCLAGSGQEFVLKLSWPSTAEYRMMKLKKMPST